LTHAGGTKTPVKKRNFANKGAASVRGDGGKKKGKKKKKRKGGASDEEAA